MRKYKVSFNDNESYFSNENTPFSSLIAMTLLSFKQIYTFERGMLSFSLTTHALSWAFPVT